MSPETGTPEITVIQNYVQFIDGSCISGFISILSFQDR